MERSEPLTDPAIRARIRALVAAYDAAWNEFTETVDIDGHNVAVRYIPYIVFGLVQKLDEFKRCQITN